MAPQNPSLADPECPVGFLSGSCPALRGPGQEREMTGKWTELGSVWARIQTLFSNHRGDGDKQTPALAETAFGRRNFIRPQGVGTRSPGTVRVCEERAGGQSQDQKRQDLDMHVLLSLVPSSSSLYVSHDHQHPHLSSLPGERSKACSL